MASAESAPAFKFTPAELAPVEERWHAVVGFEGFYEVSNLGRVRSLNRIVSAKGYGERSHKGRMLAAKPKSNGYPHVILCKPGTKTEIAVHYLVLTAFVGPRPPGAVTRHFPDGDKTNNAVWNLSWGTHKQNSDDRVAHGTHLSGAQLPWTKLSSDDVKLIRQLASAGQKTKLIAARFGIDRSNVDCIVNRKTWRNV